MTAAACPTFSPVLAGEKSPERLGQGAASGPSSNTGQKSLEGDAGAIIDFLTVVFPAAKLEEGGLTKLHHLLATVFGLVDVVTPMPIREKAWQFYRLSSVLVDRQGEVVGRIGLDGNSDTVCVSLSGAGCRWVKRWEWVAREIDRLEGRISRCDVAHDDYEGRHINVHAMRELANAGEFGSNGRPPKHRFLSDEGHGTGSTLYVGGKGHKELCVYEKGKQLGLPDSPWTRCEVRLYGKHTEARRVPTDVLRDPVAYLRGSYEVIARLIRGACSVLKTEKAKAEASAKAMVDWMHRQCGKAFGAIARAFGGDEVAIVRVLVNHVAREGSPGRFRGVMDGEQLNQELRQCLAYS